MLNISNLQKKTLKITIPIFLMMVFSFIFTPGFKVSASKPISTVVTNIYNLEDCTYFTYTEEQIDNLITTAKAKLTEKGVNADDFNKFNLVAYKGTYGNEIRFYLYNDYDIDNNRITFNLTETSSVPLTIFYQNTNGYIQYSKRNAVDPDKLVYSSFTSFKINVNISFHYFENNDDSGVYILTNFDLINKSNEVIIPQNYNTKPKSYTFNEDIDVTDISKIKVKFDLPSDINKTKKFDVNFNYKISFSDNGSGILGIPYLSSKITNSDGEEKGTTYSSNNFFKNRDDVIENMKIVLTSLSDNYFDSNSNNINFNTCIENLEKIDKNSHDKENLILNELKKWYFDKTVEKLYPLALILVNQDYYTDSYLFSNYLASNSTITDFSFIIDTFNYTGTINLNFTSNFNYTIEYEYMSDNEDYFTTINMKDYSALVMIPKTTSNVLSNQGQIYLSGVYDIEYWSDLETKTVIYRKNNFKDFIFYKQLFQSFDNAILYFIKKPVDDPNIDLYITFDSRYYSYVVKKTLSEKVVINNPNTGEDITIGDISDLYNYGLDNKNKFTFNSFLKPIKFVFESITNFYQNYCPELVQNFFYLIFVFFVVLVLIRIFL